MKASQQINILAIKRESIPEQYLSKKFYPLDKKKMESLAEIADFKWRADMEEDISYKQPIPYIGIFSDKKILTFKRSKTGGEGRLYDKYSLAIGGHIDQVPEIESKTETLYESIEREVEEEIGLDIDPHDVTPLGTINDVGGVNEYHIGIAMKYEVKNLDLTRGEQDMLLERKLMSKQEILEIYDKLESWSQIFFDDYLKEHMI